MDDNLTCPHMKSKVQRLWPPLKLKKGLYSWNEYPPGFKILNISSKAFWGFFKCSNVSQLTIKSLELDLILELHISSSITRLQSLIRSCWDTSTHLLHILFLYVSPSKKSLHSLHAKHTTRPHLRQWCCLKVNVNSFSHSWQFEACCHCICRDFSYAPEIRFRGRASLLLLLLEDGVGVLVVTVEFFGSQHIPPNIWKMKDIAFFLLVISLQLTLISSWRTLNSFVFFVFFVFFALVMIKISTSLQLIVFCLLLSNVIGLDVVNCTYAPNIGKPIEMTVENECAYV